MLTAHMKLSNLKFVFNFELTNPSRGHVRTLYLAIVLAINVLHFMPSKHYVTLRYKERQRL